MLEAITGRFRHNKRGISNVVVVMLSLILIVMIVGNVILWSYDMNELDWEKMQEKIDIVDAKRGLDSPWFVAESEYTTEVGSKVAGSFVQTQVEDDVSETFKENQVASSYRVSLLNEFTIDVTGFPLNTVTTAEIRLRYNVTSGTEKWFLTSFNWSSSDYSDNGFNVTSGNQPIPNSWNEYAVNLGDSWTSYVANNGTMRIRFSDEGTSANESTVEVDFFGIEVSVNGLRVEVKNSSSLTVHLVAIWILNETFHERLETDLYVNSGEETSYVRVSNEIPEGNLSFKAVTQRGNIAVFP